MEIILTREEMLNACCISKNRIDAKAACMIKDGMIHKDNIKEHKLSGFMHAVFNGDSRQAFSRADLHNQQALYKYVIRLIQVQEIERIHELLHLTEH